VGRVLERECRVEDAADAVAPEDVDEPGDVILVRMGHHQEVDVARVERPVPPDPAQRELRIRAAVDENRATVGSLEEDRVALPDVEDRDMESTIRARQHGDRQEHNDEARGRCARSNQPAERAERPGHRLIGEAIPAGRR
jgi:hypothetical protein